MEDSSNLLPEDQKEEAQSSAEHSGSEKDDVIKPNLPIPPELEKALSGIPENKRSAIIGVMMQKFYSGPMPPASLLQEYNDVLDNGAERLWQQFTEQGSHRRALEKTAVVEELKMGKRGQIFGFLLAGICLSMSFVLALLDHEAIAGILGGTTIVSLTTVFVLGKKAQEPDRK